MSDASTDRDALVDEPAGIVAIAALFLFAGMSALIPLLYWASTLS